MTPGREDPELRGPAQLTPPRVSVVRLNRRVLYVVGGVLVIAIVAALIALRAQGTRLASEENSSRASQLPPPGERWFDKVADREPAGPPATVLPRPETPPPPPPAPRPPSAPTAKPLTDAELEAQRRERALRAAMAAPIGAAAFEARAMTTRSSTDRATDSALAQATAGSILPAAALAAAQKAAVGTAPTSDQSAPATDRPEILPATVRGPVSPYEVKAGTIVPAVLLTGLNSDLPGQLIGQVREPVFDTEAGQHLLIPQGARLIGLFDHQVLHGQERVWSRGSGSSSRTARASA